MFTTRIITTTTMLVGFSLFLASNASAQVCLAADPIDGTSWAMRTLNDKNEVAAVVARFKITKGFSRRSSGYSLDGTFSFSSIDSPATSATIVRLAQTQGGVVLDPYLTDAFFPYNPRTGGWFQFSNGSVGMFWNFTFTDATCTTMNLTLDNSSFASGGRSTSLTMRGIATKIVSPAACPLNPNTLIDIANAPSGFSLNGFVINAVPVAVTALSTLVGMPPPPPDAVRFTSVGLYSGNVSGSTSTTSTFASVAYGSFGPVANAGTFGNYQVYFDCSGGAISMLFGNTPVQLEFVFADANYKKMWFTSLLVRNVVGDPVLVGEFFRP